MFITNIGVYNAKKEGYKRQKKKHFKRQYLTF